MEPDNGIGRSLSYWIRPCLGFNYSYKIATCYDQPCNKQPVYFFPNRHFGKQMPCWLHRESNHGHTWQFRSSHLAKWFSCGQNNAINQPWLGMVSKFIPPIKWRWLGDGCKWHCELHHVYPWDLIWTLGFVKFSRMYWYLPTLTLEMALWITRINPGLPWC